MSGGGCSSASVEEDEVVAAVVGEEIAATIAQDEVSAAVGQETIAASVDDCEATAVVVDEPITVSIEADDTGFDVLDPDGGVTAEVTEETVVAEVNCGPDGGAGGSASTDAIYVGAQDLSGERIVRATDAGAAVYADSAQLLGSHRVLGLTLNAALTGSNVNVRSAGRHEFSGWNWNTGLPIFLGSNGALTQSPPASGFILTLGFADTPTSIVLRIGRPVRRQ